MRIAQVAPLSESVPPKHYGGTERIVSYLTEELVRQGHDVTLFASGDSATRARLVAACRRSLRLNDRCIDWMAHHVLMLEQVFQRAHEFDVVHFHIDYLHFPLSRRASVPHVTTLHGRLDLPDLVPLYEQFRDMPVLSISNAQREPLPWANWQATIYHGLPEDLFRFRPKPGSYLAFLGRISPEKRVDRAIEIAKRSGIPLKAAAKVDPVDKDYFEREIEPLLRDSAVEYLGGNQR
jgi:glycosyltransferase involved in cell wall biosynthesis